MENTNYEALVHVILFILFLMFLATSVGKKDE